MPFIGRQPVIGNFQKCDSISVVNGQAAYTLQVGGVNVSPQSENHMLVSLNGILQAPVDSFTVSGSTLTFASNLVTGDVIDFVMILGNVLDLGVPSDNTVSTAKIVDGAITSAKLSAGKVLQVVSTTKTDTFTTASNSFVDVTGLSVSITPTSTSSKIFINLSLTAAGQDTVSGAGYRLMRDSTPICIGDADGSRLQITGMIPYIGSVNNNQTISGSFLDSPSTTSATTYKVQVGKSLNVYVNRTEANTDGTNIYQARSTSTITVMEISG